MRIRKNMTTQQAVHDILERLDFSQRLVEDLQFEMQEVNLRRLRGDDFARRQIKQARKQLEVLHNTLHQAAETLEATHGERPSK